MENITIIMTHPDDFERMMGGTAYLLSKKYKINIICACKGERGFAQGEKSMPRNPSIKKDMSFETAKIREQEARNAAAIVNGNITFLDLVDGEIFADKSTCEKVAELIKEQKPIAIFAHSPMEKLDHAACSNIAWQAMLLSGLIWDVEYYMFFDQQYNNFNPDIYVNITDAIEIKRKIMECHDSQLTEEDIEGQILLNKSIGVAAWCDYAEGFLSGKTLVNQRWGNKNTTKGSILLNL